MIKNIYIDGVGEIVLARRRGTRSIRLSVSGGRVRLGVPYSVSERQAIDFALKKREWIARHREPEHILQPESRIGKAHRLYFEATKASSITTKLSDNAATVRLPANTTFEQKAAQTAAKRVAKKALLAEAQSLLPQRLEALNKQLSAHYRSLNIKFIKSRWGSCSSLNDITFNAYLIQLPWDLIDYVIVHELAHTVHHNHSSDFWTEVGHVLPDFKERRKRLKTFNTDVFTQM